MANYYVDSNVAGPGSGTIGDPWDDINSNLSTLAAGDTMFLRGGGSYAAAQSYSEIVQIKVSNGCVNGSAGNEITIKNFSGEYIIFDNSTHVDIFQVQCNYWTIDGTGTDGSGDYYFRIDKDVSWQSAIHVIADNVTLRYLEITGGYYNLVDIDDSDNAIIEYCKIHTTNWTANTDTHGIIVRGFSDNGIIRYCEIFDCRGDCIEVFEDQTTEQKTGWEVHGCQLYCTAAAQGGCELAIGFKGGESWSVHNNIIHGFRHVDGSLGGTSSDGEAFIVGGGGENSEFYNNEIYDIAGNAIRVDQEGVIFRHNVIYDLAYDATVDEATVLYVTAPGDAEFYNNTIVGDYGWPDQADDKVYRCLAGGVAVLRNNIFKDTGDIVDAGTTTNSHNCWYNAFDTLSGTGDLTTDPLFTNEAGDDYTLTAGSPCRDAGTDLGYPYRGSAPDMGAFEYQTGVIVYITIITVVVVI
jgi:hypothetical protein